MSADTSTATHASPTPADFPGDAALCEDCGYPIKGLHPAGHCPECGSAVADSHPDRRTGPAFDQRPGPVGYLLTAYAVLRHPKRTFRTMQTGGRNRSCRRYLLISALLAATLWLAGLVLPILGYSSFNEWAELLGWVMTSVYGLGGLCVVFFGVIILTYIEVLGVAWFSRRREWRVPLVSAERVALYASIGWLPGAFVMGLLMNLAREGLLQDFYLKLGVPNAYAAEAVWVLLFFVGVIAMLGFETLVWIGVRRVKFANTPASAAP